MWVAILTTTVIIQKHKMTDNWSLSLYLTWVITTITKLLHKTGVFIPTIPVNTKVWIHIMAVFLSGFVLLKWLNCYGSVTMIDYDDLCCVRIIGCVHMCLAT